MNTDHTNPGSQDCDRRNPGSSTPGASRTDAGPRDDERRTFPKPPPPPPFSGAADTQTKAQEKKIEAQSPEGDDMPPPSSTGPAEKAEAKMGKVPSGPPRPDEVPPPRKYWGQGSTSTTESKMPPPPPGEDDTGKHGSSASGSQKQPEPPKSWKYLLDLEKEPPDSETELIRHRFLCVKGGLLLVGPSGIGKSSFVMQMMSFALGMPCLGFEPVRSLKILVIQAENDEHDLADMRDGVIAGMDLTQEQLQLAREQMIIATEDGLRGTDLCEGLIDPLLAEHRPDLLIIDPALAYIDGDSISGRDVGYFLRTELNPRLRKYNCGLILVHHTNKPSTGKQSFDPAYVGSGSAEWTNWARAVLSLQKVKDGIFNLSAAKRGFRLKWISTSGERIIVKQIAHCKTPGRILWEEMPEEEVAEQEAVTRSRKAKPGKEVLLSLVPIIGTISKKILQITAQEAGISRERFQGLITALIEDGVLIEVLEKRAGKKDEQLIKRLNK